jgi:predicted NUDIX family NTP pyrophosphohydrolase
VLLVTSGDTGRWIISKENIKAGEMPCKAAENEAYEEAGVKGTIIGSMPLGMYTYFKRRASGQARAATVEVYLLSVKDRSRNGLKGRNESCPGYQPKKRSRSSKSLE